MQSKNKQGKKHYQNCRNVRLADIDVSLSILLLWKNGNASIAQVTGNATDCCCHFILLLLLPCIQYIIINRVSCYWFLFCFFKFGIPHSVMTWKPYFRFLKNIYACRRLPVFLVVHTGFHSTQKYIVHLTQTYVTKIWMRKQMSLFIRVDASLSNCN